MKKGVEKLKEDITNLYHLEPTDELEKLNSEWYSGYKQALIDIQRDLEKTIIDEGI